MAGRPLRRARLAAAEHARQLRLRGGEEPDPPDYFATLGAEPVRQVVVPPPMRTAATHQAPTAATISFLVLLGWSVIQ